MQLGQTVMLLRLSEDVLSADSLQIVQQCLEEADAPVIHLDLRCVRLPTADGLGALVVLNKALRERGGELVLFNLSSAAYEVFMLTRLIEVLLISLPRRPKKDTAEPQVSAQEFSLDGKF